MENKRKGNFYFDKIPDWIKNSILVDYFNFDTEKMVDAKEEIYRGEKQVGTLSFEQKIYYSMLSNKVEELKKIKKKDHLERKKIKIDKELCLAILKASIQKNFPDEKEFFFRRGFKICIKE